MARGRRRGEQCFPGSGGPRSPPPLRSTAPFSRDRSSTGSRRSRLSHAESPAQNAGEAHCHTVFRPNEGPLTSFSRHCRIASNPIALMGDRINGHRLHCRWRRLAECRCRVPALSSIRLGKDFRQRGPRVTLTCTLCTVVLHQILANTGDWLTQQKVDGVVALFHVGPVADRAPGNSPPVFRPLGTLVCAGSIRPRARSAVGGVHAPPGDRPPRSRRRAAPGYGLRTRDGDTRPARGSGCLLFLCGRQPGPIKRRKRRRA